MFTTYVGTSTGVFRVVDGHLEPLGLDAERVWAIHAWRDGNTDTILAGSYGNGLFRSTDSGKTWEPANEGLTSSAFRTIAPDPHQPDSILAGTEPGRIYRSRDGGQSWTELTGVLELDGIDAWYLPYSPRAGAVRNIYAPPGDNQRLLASVEVGGLLDSHDGGATWSYLPVLGDDDFHHITGHPDDPNLLFTSLGYASIKRPDRDSDYRFGGIARSRDGGATWQKLETDYTRATIVPPSDHSLLLAGPAPQVGRNGRIVVSSDAGDSWTPASNGIETPMHDMVELFVPAPDNTIWAICSGGRLLKATVGDWHWTSALPDTATDNVESVSFVTT